MFRTGVDPITHRPVRYNAPNGMPWPRGFINGNPGNLDYVPANKWQGQLGIEDRIPGRNFKPRFAKFSSASRGARAMMLLLVNYQDKHSINTIDSIVDRWAPATENNTSAYKSALSHATGFGINARLDLQSYEHNVPLAKAICNHELGNPRQFGLREWYPQEMWDEAAKMAGLVRRTPRPASSDANVVVPAVAAGGLTLEAAAPHLPMIKDLVKPDSIMADVIVGLVIAGVLYLLYKRLKKRKREVV